MTAAVAPGAGKGEKVNAEVNPYPTDTDESAIWDMIVRRDIEAFSVGDWGAVEADFQSGGFVGLDAGNRADPDSWTLAFPTLLDYRDSWLAQRSELSSPPAVISADLFAATALREIEIRGDAAVAHKKFDGVVRQADGERIPLDWQTLYFCRRTASGWKIGGFVGYLPRQASPEVVRSSAPAKQLPEGARQHQGAGPYSPVLTVRADEIVVISGQAALTDDGRVIDVGIQAQTRRTLENCRQQLKTADCTFDDVFKVNVFLSDLDGWGEFNEVYQSVLPEPRPVRTCVGAALLPGLEVEVEMWAARHASRQTGMANR